MNSIKTLSPYCVVLLTSLVCTQALAYTCTTKTPATLFTPPSMTIERDLPVGAPIGNPIYINNIQAFTCTTNPSPSISYQEVAVKGVGDYSQLIDDRSIFKTNIAGVGYAIGGYACGNLGLLYVTRRATDIGIENARRLCSVNGLFNQPVTENLAIHFYKTEQNTGIGTVTGRQVASVLLRVNQTDWINPESIVNMGPFSVYTVACTVNSPTISVPLGIVKPSEFKGYGSSPDDSRTAQFSIPLTCNSDANINLEIGGTTFDFKNGVLATDQGDDAASGVGIQVLYKNKPIVLKTPFEVDSPTSEGLFNIPLQARYFQTASTVGIGSVKASATFTITYK